MPHITLSNGLQMPILGFGVFQIPDPAECRRSVVVEAIVAGDRFVHTATSSFSSHCDPARVAWTNGLRLDLA